MCSVVCAYVVCVGGGGVVGVCERGGGWHSLGGGYRFPTNGMVLFLEVLMDRWIQVISQVESLKAYTLPVTGPKSFQWLDISEQIVCDSE